ncbi:replication endonuclease [Vibrio sp. NTOU-M3]|uniref:replication endonuclease n=1 Tax=Vibrio sp. NTOU-M3 TaxID=3234954 RepID=UPI00349F47C6
MNHINLMSVDLDDRAFVMQRLSRFSTDVQRLLLNEYLSLSSKFERNSYLRVMTEQLASRLAIPFSKLELNVSEDELRAKSKHLAQSVLALRRHYQSDEQALDTIRAFVRQHGCKAYEGQYTLLGELGRYSDPKWWLRKLRVALRRNIEIVMHHLNRINKQRSLYCSKPTLIARIKQRAYQRAYLESTIATNELGQRFSLLELSRKGVSDPKIRKGELMMRARGFEELAKELNHVATFLTITCPSKYHRSYSTSGHANPKWGGYSPSDGQWYLNNIWQLMRSKLNRLNVRFYGFRVAEPQHDGTPHWHLLLFVDRHHHKTMVTVMRDYAMREDREEKGAAEHRFTEVKIDASKGSATGYIAKYISKNIDGSDLDAGVYGEDPKDAAARVDAWASCWGIRQFQQLGGCSVTVWRELRRLKGELGLSKQQQSVVDAADKGDWKTFTQLMGGVFSLRKAQLFKPYYELTIDKETGVIKTSMYCSEEWVRSLKGVVSRGQEIITRVMQWRIASNTCLMF